MIESVRYRYDPSLVTHNQLLELDNAVTTIFPAGFNFEKETKQSGVPLAGYIDIVMTIASPSLDALRPPPKEKSIEAMVSGELKLDGFCLRRLNSMRRAMLKNYTLQLAEAQEQDLRKIGAYEDQSPRRLAVLQREMALTFNRRIRQVIAMLP